jgi:hypothetical protein
LVNIILQQNNWCHVYHTCEIQTKLYSI